MMVLLPPLDQFIKYHYLLFSSPSFDYNSKMAYDVNIV